MKIKFNMDFHGEYIRNLEDLRNNFSVEDILEAYDNGLLVKWLDARYYTDELKQVKAIEAKNVRGVLEELIRIFCPETEQEEIDENLSLYYYLDERRKYREYVNANGLDELATLRKERDTLNDENAKLRTELAAFKKKNENLKHEAERQKQSSSTSRSSFSSLIPLGLSLYYYLDERRKYREYVNANGLDELATLRKERDTLNDENAKLRTELVALKKENENLKHEAERQKQSSSTSRSSSSSLIEAKIPAGRFIRRSHRDLYFYLL